MTDTAGSFAFDDDDEDFGAMLDRAASASEDSGDLKGLGVEETPAKSPKTAKAAEPNKETLLGEVDALYDRLEDENPAEEESTLDPNPEVEERPVVEAHDLEGVPDETFDEPQPYSEPIPTVVTEPEPEPEPVRTPEPAPVQPSTPAAARVRVPTEADQIKQAATIIRVLDAYRGLNTEEKSVVIQFVTNGEFGEAEDDFVVVKVINADGLLSETMTALIAAFNHQPVERAFFALALSSKVLHALGDLVTVFTQEDYDVKLPNLDYAREVVGGIEKLSDHEINFVKATESVLAAAKEPTPVD